MEPLLPRAEPARRGGDHRSSGFDGPPLGSVSGGGTPRKRARSVLEWAGWKEDVPVDKATALFGIQSNGTVAGTSRKDKVL